MNREAPDRAIRERICSDLERSYAIEASAGTGKTSLVVARVLALLESGRVRIGEVAVITFTERAAQELGVKIRRELARRIAELAALGPSGSERDERLERLRLAMREFESAVISTIHAFAASLLRARPVEAGVDPLFRLADEELRDALMEEEWERTIVFPPPAAGALLHALLVRGVKLESLWRLARFIADNRDMMLGEGSAIPPVPDPAAHAADAASWIAEAVPRVRKLCLSPATDKLVGALEEAAARAAQLAKLGPASREQALLDERWASVKETLGHKANWSNGCVEEARAVARQWNIERSRYRAALGAHLAGVAGSWIRHFIDTFEERKRREGVLDFQDLLLRARALLRKRGVAAGLAKVHRAILIDEFQDTDPLQVEIAALLTGDGEDEAWQARRPIPGALVLVGDPKQSIYRFRRADIEIYAEARRWLARAEDGAAAVTITTSFRSRPGIIAWVNALFAKLLEGEAGGVGYAPLAEWRGGGNGPAVLYLRAATDGSEKPKQADRRRALEARLLAGEIREAVAVGRWKVGDADSGTERSVRYGDIAILLRSFTGLGAYEDALQDEGIPLVTAGGRRYHLRPEVAWFGSLLEAVERPHDEIAVVAALRSPYFGLTDEEILAARLARVRLDPLAADDVGDAARAPLAQLRAWHLDRNSRPVGESVRAIAEASGALALAACASGGEQTTLNLFKLFEAASRHDREGGDFRSFIRWLRRGRKQELEEGETPLVEQGEDAVRISTIHNAKGLEFPIVILADLASPQSLRETGIADRRSGTIEFKLAAGSVACETPGLAAALGREKLFHAAERKRLFYVGATRAADLLVLPLLGDPSPESFLQDLYDGGGDAAEPAAPRAPGEMVVTLRNGASAIERVVPIAPAGAQPELESDAMASGGTAGAQPESEPETAAGAARPAGRVEAASEVGAWGASLAAWSAERDAILERGSRGPRIIAASDAWDDARDEIGGGSGRGAAHVPAGADTPGASPHLLDTRAEAALSKARRFGTAVHSVLERSAWAAPDSLDQLAAATALELGLEDRAEEIASAARRALASPALVRARARRALREMPLSCLEGDVLIEGQADLVYEEDDGSLVVVDYKTDAVADEAAARRIAETYRRQVDLYALAVERACKRKVRETVLVFARPGIEVRHPFDEAARTRIGEFLAREQRSHIS